MRRLWIVVLAATAALGAVASAAGAPAAKAVPAVRAKAPDPNAIQPDPNIRRGTLPNGLRYAVLSHPEPKGAISIRFRIEAGSIDETDDERGVAHFSEHMAFAGGKRIGAGRMEQLFADQGVQFGRDQNAFTGAYDTTYHLDIPQATKANLDLGFEWLHDVADGLDITPSAVVHERGVILHERETGESPSAVVTRRLRAMMEPELRLTQRDPIGTLESISSMTADQVRSFHDRWYRPENALIVVVGDLPADELEARIKATFSDWQGKGPAPQRPAPSKTDLKRPFDLASWPSEHQLADEVAFCVKRAPEPHGPDTLATQRKAIVRELWQVVLNQRLGEIARRPQPPFHSAQVLYADDNREMAANCLTLNPDSGDWRAGLTAGRMEMRRLLEFGPTPAELKLALSGRMAVMRYGRDHNDSYPSSSLATFILGEIDSNEVTAPMTERYRAEAAAQDITPDEVRKQMRADWQGGGPVMVIISSSPPALDDAKSFWAKLDASPDPADDYKPALQKAWAYADFGPAGKVVKREEIADPGFVRLTFANGVVMNFKSTPFAKGDAVVNVSFGDGRAGLGKANMFGAGIGAQLLLVGGLGKDSFEDLRKMFPDHLWSAGLAIGPHRFVLGGRTTPADLDVQMQTLAAFLTDPGFSPEMESMVGSQLGNLYRAYGTTPYLAAADALNRTIAPTGPLTLPTPSGLGSMRADAFAAELKPAMTTAPLEVTVVADMDEAAAVAAVAKTLGALPPRKPQPAAINPDAFARWPASLDHDVHTVFSGPPERAAVEVMWPLWNGTPDRRRDERGMRYVVMLLQDALRHRLRDKMGETYAPSASMHMDDGSDQGAVLVLVECSPGKTEEVLSVIRDVAAELAAGKITAQELENERKPVLAQEADRHTDINWWVQIMDGSARNPVQVDDARTWDAVYGSISLEEVKRLAHAWLTGPGLASIASPKTTVAAAVTTPVSAVR
ncbi:MAG TPA: insulinase family protein [Caulobacteraceae bacterium]|jgi:zinc protease